MVSGIHIESFDVRNRLAELGLGEEDLHHVVERGQSVWAMCTPNHPPMAPGFMRWSEAVVALREKLIPLGWEPRNEGNLPFTVNSSGSVAITVATGDEATGKADGSPCTNSKGPRTAMAVTDNRRQLGLFDGVVLEDSNLDRINERVTWLLLMHRDRESGEIRCELSRPINMNGEGRVDRWAERIILTPIPSDMGALQMPGAGALQQPDIIVEVKKRG